MSPLCGVRAIYILTMCISSSVFDFPLTSNVGDRSLNPKCTYLGCLGPVHCGARGRWHSMLTRRCPTDGIYIGFGFRSGWFGVLWFGVCSADRGAVLHASRPLHCRGVCEISLWSVGYVLSRSASDFGRGSGLVRVSLEGQAPELWNQHMYVNSHDQNIFLFFVFVLNLCCSLVVLCHVMLAINCTELKTELNWIETIASCMIVHFSARILKLELVCKFGVRFHISIIISCLGSRFPARNYWFFYSIIISSYTKYFVQSYTVDVVFTLSYKEPFLFVNMHGRIYRAALKIVALNCFKQL